MGPMRRQTLASEKVQPSDVATREHSGISGPSGFQERVLGLGQSEFLDDQERLANLPFLCLTLFLETHMVLMLL